MVLIEYFCDIFFEWSYEFILDSKQLEGEFSRMEPLSCESIFEGSFIVYFMISIGFISYNRMPHICHVYTDLMCTACEELNFE